MTMIISYSSVFKWQTCRRQYYYRFILGLAPIEESEPIKTGIKGHSLLETFHKSLQEGKTKEQSLEAVHAQAKKMIDAGDITESGSLLKSLVLVDNYIKETDFTAKAVLVENRFLVPASMLSDDPVLSDIQIGFTPDVVFERTGRKLDVEDYKFVGRAWSASKLNRFPQLKLYQVLMKAMGYTISRTILRFFNTTTGKITEKNYVMEAPEAATLTKDFLSGVREVSEYNRLKLFEQAEAPRTMNYTACQYCPFEFVCTLEAEGKDASKTMATQFTRSSYDYNR